MFDVKSHLMDLKGKEYLQVMWRLVWFRDEHPDWQINTELLSDTGDRAVFKAIVADENGMVKSVGHGSETTKDFRDNLEKAETKAVGRALAMLGYGTQFAPELDEGERIVDSPVAPKTKAVCEHCGKLIQSVTDENGKTWSMDWIIQYGRRNFEQLLCWDCCAEATRQKKAAAIEAKKMEAAKQVMAHEDGTL